MSQRWCLSPKSTAGEPVVNFNNIISHQIGGCQWRHCGARGTCAALAVPAVRGGAAEVPRGRWAATGRRDGGGVHRGLIGLGRGTPDKGGRRASRSAGRRECRLAIRSPPGLRPARILLSMHQRTARVARPTLKPEAARRWQSLSTGTAPSFRSCRGERRGRVGRAQRHRASTESRHRVSRPPPPVRAPQDGAGTRLRSGNLSCSGVRLVADRPAAGQKDALGYGRPRRCSRHRQPNARRGSGARCA